MRCLSSTSHDAYLSNEEDGHNLFLVTYLSNEENGHNLFLVTYLSNEEDAKEAQAADSDLAVIRMKTPSGTRTRSISLRKRLNASVSD